MVRKGLGQGVGEKKAGRGGTGQRDGRLRESLGLGEGAGKAAEAAAKSYAPSGTVEPPTGLLGSAPAQE